MAECCGRKLVTPFCPMCGIKLDGGPLYEILTHIRKVLKVRVTEYRGLNTGYGKDKSDSWHEEHRKKLDSIVQKWERWETAILQAIDLEDTFLKEQKK